MQKLTRAGLVCSMSQPVNTQTHWAYFLKSKSQNSTDALQRSATNLSDSLHILKNLFSSSKELVGGGGGNTPHSTDFLEEKLILHMLSSSSIRGKKKYNHNSI